MRSQAWSSASRRALGLENIRFLRFWTCNRPRGLVSTYFALSSDAGVPGARPDTGRRSSAPHRHPDEMLRAALRSFGAYGILGDREAALAQPARELGVVRRRPHRQHAARGERPVRGGKTI